MNDKESFEYNQIQKAHWNNVRTILQAVDSLFALMENENDPPKQEVLRIAQNLVRDMKIKWQDEDGTMVLPK
ncbi:MAG: hypothetical protein WBA83_01725 [Burkholderiaceae bacterium]